VKTRIIRWNEYTILKHCNDFFDVKTVVALLTVFAFHQQTLENHHVVT